MRRVVIVIAILAAAGAIGGWLWTVRDRPLPPPPSPPDVAGLDPLVREAVEDALAATRADPTDAGARATLADVYHANGLFAPAIEAYEQALAARPDRFRVRYRLAVARAETGLFADALAALDRAAADGAADHPPLHWRRGLWLMELGRLDEAMAAFERAEAIDPRSGAAVLGRARVHLLRHEAEAAAAILEPLVARNDRLGYAHQLLGLAYHGLGRSREAAAHLRRAGVRRLEWPDPWTDELAAHRTGLASRFAAIDAMVERGEIASALATLDELRRRTPENATVLAKIGETHLGAGAPGRARPLLERALEIDGGSLIARVLLARVYREQGRLDLARAELDRTIALQPAFAHAHLELAALHASRGGWSDAEAALLEAVRHGLDDPATRLELARVRMRRERWAEAATGLEQILAEDPARVDAMLLLALSRGHQGDHATAAGLLGEARRLRPQDPAISETAGLLRTLAESQRGAAP